MADVTKTSDQSLNSILNKLGINSNEEYQEQKRFAWSGRLFKAYDHTTSKSGSFFSNG